MTVRCDRKLTGKSRQMLEFASVVSGVSGLVSAAAGWFALNFFGRSVLALREKRKEALEVAERYAYVGLHRSPSDELQDRALGGLNNAGNSLRALDRERSLATRIYCRLLHYDLRMAAIAVFGLAEAARGEFRYDEAQRRLTLHVLFVALGSVHHMSSADVAATRAEMAKWSIEAET